MYNLIQMLAHRISISSSGTVSGYSTLTVCEIVNVDASGSLMFPTLRD